MKSITSILVALMCLVVVNVRSQTQTSTPVSGGGGGSSAPMEEINYLPIGSFQALKAWAIENVTSGRVQVWSTSQTGRRSPKIGEPFAIPAGSAPSEIARLISGQPLSITVARPDVDSIGIYVSLEDAEGYQLFYGQSEFRLVKSGDTWGVAGTITPTLQIAQNVRFPKLDGASEMQVFFRNESGQVTDPRYISLGERAFIPAYIAGKRGEAYVVSRLSDGTEVRRAFGLQSGNYLPGVSMGFQVNPPFYNVREFGVNESKPLFVVAEKAQSYLLGFLQYTTATDVTLTPPFVYQNNNLIERPTVFFIRLVGSKDWYRFETTVDSPNVTKLGPGKYWMYVPVSAFGDSPKNPEAPVPPNDGGGKG